MRRTSILGCSSRRSTLCLEDWGWSDKSPGEAVEASSVIDEGVTLPCCPAGPKAACSRLCGCRLSGSPHRRREQQPYDSGRRVRFVADGWPARLPVSCPPASRSEGHTAELQSLNRISYAGISLQHKI